MHKFMALLAANRRRGYFRAESAEGGRAVIYLYDVIVGSDSEAEWWGGVSPGAFARELAALDASEIELRVNCPGGDVWGGRAIAAALREYPGTITAVVDGVAASAASYVVQACSRVEMGDGSVMMIHNAWSFAYGNASEFRRTAALLDKIDGQIADSYAKAAARRGVEAPDFTALMAAETWFTPAEAISAGLADAERDDEALGGLAWDLSAYAKPPANRAPEPEQEPVAPVEPVNDTETEIAHRRRRATAMLLRTA